MDRVLFLGGSAAQLEALPPQVRNAFLRAIEMLEANPSVPPEDAEAAIETRPLAGPLALFRISVRPRRDDPGYRGVYHFDGTKVFFVRFVRRDADTYKGLRRLHRLIPSDKP